jgi:hypothetical protein
MRDGHHGRVHAHTDLTGRLVLLGDAQQLDDVAQPAGHGDVVGGDAADSLVVDVAGDDLHAEGDGRDDGRLGTCVEPFDIGRGIALGEPQGLRLGQRDAVVGTVFGHLGQDEVGGAVDDAHDAPDRLAAQALAQRADQWDATSDGGFEQQVDTGAVGCCVQLGADVRQQLLVGGDDRLAVRQRGRDQFSGRLDAADDLDDQIDARVGHHSVRVAGQHTVGQRHASLAADVAHRHRRDLELQPGSRFDRTLLLAHQLHQRGAHVAAAEQADPDHISIQSHGVRLGDAGDLPAVHCTRPARRGPGRASARTVARGRRPG